MLGNCVAHPMLTVLDLFSGIGGLALGLERAGLQTVQFCEREPFCQRVLSKHWPLTPCHDDVRTLDGRSVGFDVLVGGPPCQRTSVAAAISGNRTGETLWPEMFRIGIEGRAKWWIVEQPAGNAKWEAAVKGDLEGAGYYVQRLQRTARDCGAPHRRRRVFLIAHAMRERCEAVAWLGDAPPSDPKTWPAPPRGAWYSRKPRGGGVDDGLPRWVDRLRALGNAVVPQVAEEIGRAILAAEADGASFDQAKVWHP
jgi:DNA (cytosine-5)-methyltransferase 1